MTKIFLSYFIMKNHYQVIGVSCNANHDEIKLVAREKIKTIKKSLLSNQEKKYKIEKIVNSYRFLKVYQNRKKLDAYLDNKQVVPVSYSNNLFGNNFFSLGKLFPIPLPNFKKDLSQIKKSSKSQYYVQSYQSTSTKKDGKIVTNQTYYTDNNGEKKRKKIVTTIDKDGKKVTKEIPYFDKN